ncbi:EpsG family protein [Limosilactobacillus fermentum]|uniref:EpsG family protein n=1 Tax=Limosilactobacillus fermentum TaxID=1613 RepID=UPI0021A7A54E|nr:EpsG family protein [Limosilactobacillus fermentum]MCT3459598.1 EpsG family protein [Limosilactobacillus fermentum]MDH5017951.1 EpsG family protein [Limosilactobacillus fermentum]
MLYVAMETFEGIYQGAKKQSKFVGLLGFLVLAYLMGTANPDTTFDYSTYDYYYNYSGMTGIFYFEKGYSLIARYFYNIGWSYPEFRLFISAVSFGILYYSVSKFTKNLAFFIFIYGVTMFFIDATQIRNFIMISLVIFGVSFIANGKTFKNYIFCIIAILFSAQIHSMGYIFLLVPLLNLVSFEKLEKNFQSVSIVVIFIVGILFIVGKGILSGGLTVLLNHFSSRNDIAQRLADKYSSGTGRMHIIEVSVVALLTIYIAFCIVKYCSDQELKKRLIPLFWGLVVSIVTLPLLTLAMDYSRIVRNSFVFMIVIMSVFYEKRYLFNVRRVFFSWLILISLISNVYISNALWGPAYIQSIPYLMQF